MPEEPNNVNTTPRDNEVVQERNSEERAIWDEMFVCRGEIARIMHRDRNRLDKGGGGLEGAATDAAAYVLCRACSSADPPGYSFEEDGSMDADIKGLARTVGVAEHWAELAGLLSRHKGNIFGLVSCLRISTDPTATPENLWILADELLELKDGDSFADFCCGSGSVVRAMKGDNTEIRAYGYDISVNSIAAAKIKNAFAEDKIRYKVQDLFELGLEENKPTFDKIFSNYPPGMKIRDSNRGQEYRASLEERIPSIAKITSADWLFHMLMMDMLADDGRAIGFMSNGAAWNGSDSAVRRYFAENGWIECVITLPEKLFAETALPVSMIVFSHHNTGVKLVDASELFESGRRVNYLTDENLDQIMELVRGESEHSRFISLEELRENDYVLSLKKYAVLDIKNGQPFKNVIRRITRGAQLSARDLDKITTMVPTGMQYLMLANIRNGMIDPELPYLKKIDKKEEKYCLTNHCLILSKNGYPYKIAVAEIREGQKILGNGNLYIIELDEEKIDPYYLAAFFESEMGIKALKGITVGASIPNIGVEQLKNLIIPVPPLEEQKRLAGKYRNARDEIAALLAKLESTQDRMTHVIEE